MSLPENPSTRHEEYLAALIGQQNDYPEYPSSRLEEYLDYIVTEFIGRYYTKSEVEALVNTLHEPIIVATLPEASADTRGRIYMVGPKGTGPDIYYEEYLTVRTGEEGSYTYTWEAIGTTAGVNVDDLLLKMEGDDFITVDENEAGDKVAFSIDSTVKPWQVRLATPSGTLSAEDYAKLNISSQAQIVYDGDVYTKVTVQPSFGYMVFAVGAFMSETIAALKAITIITNTQSQDFMTYTSGSFDLMSLYGAAKGVEVLTTLPTTDNTGNGYAFVYSENELVGSQRHDGYIYLEKKSGPV